ncbi:cyclohexanone 1,2-monooxygenase-like protein [Rhodocollybia butyracea]|uniref:Cyclohexanone 1,2-monooxygenase-like protein n=1 Tax=Rhodocollybia butyracea TaxID=206335 RepID=A0A9P5Q5I8_9AGAR|nr:cyclohexanone 1,2-monooxygenase-like protein [Rhodocollybia butyracea]
MTSSSDLDVLIVGAGFAGLFELHHLRAMGCTVKVFEAGGDIGGVWYHNRYDGARVDSVVPVYEFSDEHLWKDFDWSQRYPDWKEIRRYFRYVDEKLDLRKDIVFNRKVVSARWNADKDRWYVTSQDGSVVNPRFLLLCVGNNSKIYIPDIAGMDRFRGECHHTARWPQEGLELDGKRVAVIGTGASGVQIVQDLGPRASQLTVFQRTPNIAFPMRQQSIDAETSRRMKEKVYRMVYRRRRQTYGGHVYDLYPKNSTDATPEERYLFFEDLWNRCGGLELVAANYKDIRRNQEVNDELYAFWRAKVLPRIHRTDVQNILAPLHSPHPIGAKRASLEVSYYETFNLPHVELVDLVQNPILNFTENGILAADGRERPFDVIILATGFDAMTGGIIQIDIEGTDGISISDKWAKGVRTNLGMMTSNFPNMFFMYAVQSPAALANGPSVIEAQGEWINACIKSMLDDKLTRIESLKDAEEEWRQVVFESMSGSLFDAPTSVFMGRNIPGKKFEPLLYFGGIPEYTRLCQEKMKDGYAGFLRSSVGVPS